jgi:hypothetical protein
MSDAAAAFAMAMFSLSTRYAQKTADSKSA